MNAAHGQWLVELESGVWLAPVEGDPGRSLARQHAATFESRAAAEAALEAAKAYRPLRRARVLAAWQVGR